MVKGRHDEMRALLLLLPWPYSHHLVCRESSAHERPDRSACVRRPSLVQRVVGWARMMSLHASAVSAVRAMRAVGSAVRAME